MTRQESINLDLYKNQHSIFARNSYFEKISNDLINSSIRKKGILCMRDGATRLGKMNVNKVLGQGTYGRVMQIEDEDGYAMAVKKIGIKNKTVDAYKNSGYHVEKVFDYGSNKYYCTNVWHELILMFFTNKLVSLSISPNFPITYQECICVGESFKIDKSAYDNSLFTFQEIASTNLYNLLQNDNLNLKKNEPLAWNIITQVFLSLYVFSKYTMNSHQDCAWRNIFVKNIASGGHWEYVTEFGTFYIPNMGLQIWLGDLGMSEPSYDFKNNQIHLLAVINSDGYSVKGLLDSSFIASSEKKKIKKVSFVKQENQKLYPFHSIDDVSKFCFEIEKNSILFPASIVKMIKEIKKTFSTVAVYKKEVLLEKTSNSSDRLDALELKWKNNSSYQALPSCILKKYMLPLFRKKTINTGVLLETFDTNKILYDNLLEAFKNIVDERKIILNKITPPPYFKMTTRSKTNH